MGPPPALSVSFHEHEGNTCGLSRRYVEDRKRMAIRMTGTKLALIDLQRPSRSAVRREQVSV